MCAHPRGAPSLPASKDMPYIPAEPHRTSTLWTHLLSWIKLWFQILSWHRVFSSCPWSMPRNLRHFFPTVTFRLHFLLLPSLRAKGSLLPLTRSPGISPRSAALGNKDIYYLQVRCFTTSFSFHIWHVFLALFQIRAGRAGSNFPLSKLPTPRWAHQDMRKQALLSSACAASVGWATE